MYIHSLSLLRWSLSYITSLFFYLDHLAFFRRTLGTTLGSKYKPYWNYTFRVTWSTNTADADPEFVFKKREEGAKMMSPSQRFGKTASVSKSSKLLACILNSNLGTILDECKHVCSRLWTAIFIIIFSI